MGKNRLNINEYKSNYNYEICNSAFIVRYVAFLSKIILIKSIFHTAYKQGHHLTMF